MYIGSNARRHLSTPYDEGGLPRGEATFGTGQRLLAMPDLTLLLIKEL
jgi:hypothetical protein